MPRARARAGAGARRRARRPRAGAAGGGGQKNGSFLGKDVPSFDPGSEIMTWDGKNWNVNNNRIFQARFEKYLNAPEETTATDRAVSDGHHADPRTCSLRQRHRAEHRHRLSPAHRRDRVSTSTRGCAIPWPTPSTAPGARSNAQNRLAAANDALEAESKQQYWNAQHVSAGDNAREADSTQQSGRSTKGGAAKRRPRTTEAFEDTMRMTEHTKRIAEIEAQIKANQVKRELNSIQAKVEFQALILQFFLQRRFQHVLMATRFYRAVFNDGDTKLNVGKDTKDLFEKSSGMPPTVGTLDSMANEALRDVREGVQAYQFPAQKSRNSKAPPSGSAKPSPMGEFVPEIRTLPRDKKRQALEFTHKTNQLISAIDVKDYTLAEQLVNDLGKIAKDFDNSKPMGIIETSKQVSDMHLAKARNAALKGDNADAAKPS